MGYFLQHLKNVVKKQLSQSKENTIIPSMILDIRVIIPTKTRYLVLSLNVYPYSTGLMISYYIVLTWTTLS